jgi:molecular chaperone GrpE (heat shock protein)
MVKTEIMPGYTLHDKVIRPAKVIVTNKLEDKNKK